VQRHIKVLIEFDSEHSDVEIEDEVMQAVHLITEESGIAQNVTVIRTDDNQEEE
jgi:hypothetical protein